MKKYLQENSRLETNNNNQKVEINKQHIRIRDLAQKLDGKTKESEDLKFKNAKLFDDYKIEAESFKQVIINKTAEITQI